MLKAIIEQDVLTGAYDQSLKKRKELVQKTNIQDQLKMQPGAVQSDFNH